MLQKRLLLYYKAALTDVACHSCNNRFKFASCLTNLFLSSSLANLTLHCRKYSLTVVHCKKSRKHTVDIFLNFISALWNGSHTLTSADTKLLLRTFYTIEIHVLILSHRNNINFSRILSCKHSNEDIRVNPSSDRAGGDRQKNIFGWLLSCSCQIIQADHRYSTFEYHS